MSESLEDLLICQICLEEYQESGSRIPRILPCSHTLCEGCLIQLLAGVGVLKCPVCKAQHAAPRKQRTFPQSKFILSFIRWRAKQSEKESDAEIILCPNHEKELTLFCKKTQCQTLICSGCLTKHHLKHEVIDADEHRKEKLLDNLASCVQSLSFKKDLVMTVQKKNEQCLKKLKEEKRSILSLVRDKYDSLIREATNQMEEHKREMTSLKENLVLLNNIKQYISRGTLSMRQVKNCQETVDTVTEHNDQAPLELHYMEYTENKDKERLVQELCGEISRKNHNLKPPDIQSEPTGKMCGSFVKHSQEIGSLLVKPFQHIEKNVPVASQHVDQSERIRRCKGLLKKTWQTDVLTNSPRLHYSPNFMLKRSFKTRYKRDGVFYLSTAGRNSVFVSGMDADSAYNVTHYNLVTGEERCTVRLDDVPAGMTTVLYDNRWCIAVAHWVVMRIEFRPVDDLQQVVHSLEVSPHQPYHICAVTSSPSQLLYCDYKTNKIHRVDCSTAPPTPQGEIPIVHDGQKYVWDMCTSGDLLVVARGHDGVFAYTLDGGELKWKVSGRLLEMQLDIYVHGVTADDQGHLFVCDVKNRCVHALFGPDGKHLGMVVREEEQGLGKPYMAAWHSDSASLVVANVRVEVSKYLLSVISHQDQNTFPFFLTVTSTYNLFTN